MSGTKLSRYGSWRIVAATGAALAVLTVLAVGVLTGSPRPRAANSGSETQNHRSASASSGSAQTANPNPSAHPITGPTPPPVGAGLTLGKVSAPVTMVEFGDFQCTSCGAFYKDTEATLIRRYVDTGIVRLVWRDFPWVDSQSVAAAVAARAAGLQDRFWAYHDYLFAHQFATERSGLLTSNFLLSVARKVGLNLTQFRADIRDPALRRAVLADDAFGQRIGVPGTPAFLIGGRPLFGALPLAAFASAIARARG
jgi:protein-disulfide isomerase